MLRSAAGTCRGNAVWPDLHNSLAPFMTNSASRCEPCHNSAPKKGTGGRSSAAVGRRKETPYVRRRSVLGASLRFRIPCTVPQRCERMVVYNRRIFLISFLKEVFLRSVILFQSDFCFMRKDLRFRLKSFEFRRCGKFDKKNRRSLKICSGASCAGHSTRRP
jgi:hypothetical protein